MKRNKTLINNWTTKIIGEKTVNQSGLQTTRTLKTKMKDKINLKTRLSGPTTTVTPTGTQRTWTMNTFKTTMTIKIKLKTKIKTKAQDTKRRIKIKTSLNPFPLASGPDRLRLGRSSCDKAGSNPEIGRGLSTRGFKTARP